MKSLKKSALPYLFCMPFILSFLIFQVYPSIYTLYLSFTSFDGDSDPVWVGMKNYSRLMHDDFFMTSVYNTLVIWLVNFLPQLSLAMFLASLFTYSKIKGIPVFRAVFYFPSLVSAASISILFLTVLDTNHGVLNQILMGIGLTSEKIGWIDSEFGARTSVSFIQWWMWFGNSTIVCLAGMTAISRDYYDAASVEGANGWQIFWRITVPLLKPTLLYILVTSLIGGLQIFDIPYLLTGPGPNNSTLTMVMHMYQQAFSFNHYGYASAISWGIFIIIGLCAALLFKAIKPDTSTL